MSNKAYDTLKLISQIFVPILVFLSALLKIWDVPHTAELTATLAAIDTLLGSIVAVLKVQYDKKA